MKKNQAIFIYFPSVCIVIFLMILMIQEKHYKPTFILIFLLIMGTIGFITILKRSKMDKTDSTLSDQNK